jgi:hypothetical protein
MPAGKVLAAAAHKRLLAAAKAVSSEISMKLALCAVLSLLLIGTAAAGQGNVSIGKLRLADAASDACLSNCASQNDACKRVCPTTLGAPCQSSCDSQAQTCRQSCQNR